MPITAVGMCIMLRKNMKRQISDYNKAIGIAPNLTTAYISLGLYTM